MTNSDEIILYQKEWEQVDCYGKYPNELLIKETIKDGKKYYNISIPNISTWQESLYDCIQTIVDYLCKERGVPR